MAEFMMSFNIFYEVMHWKSWEVVKIIHQSTFIQKYVQSTDTLLMNENDANDNSYLIFVLPALHLS